MLVVPTLQVFVHNITQPITNNYKQESILSHKPNMQAPNIPNPWPMDKLQMLVLPLIDILGYLPNIYLKVLPKFNGVNELTNEDHLTTF